MPLRNSFNFRMVRSTICKRFHLTYPLYGKKLDMTQHYNCVLCVQCTCMGMGSDTNYVAADCVPCLFGLWP